MNYLPYIITTFATPYRPLPALTIKSIPVRPTKKFLIFRNFLHFVFLQKPRKSPVLRFLCVCYSVTRFCSASPLSIFLYESNRICILSSPTDSSSFKLSCLNDSNILRCFCSRLCFTFSHSFFHASITCAIICPIWIR